MKVLIVGQFSQCFADIYKSRLVNPKGVCGPQKHSLSFERACELNPTCVREVDADYRPFIGYGVYNAADDGTVKLLRANFDSSD